MEATHCTAMRSRWHRSMRRNCVRGNCVRGRMHIAGRRYGMELRRCSMPGTGRRTVPWSMGHIILGVLVVHGMVHVMVHVMVVVMSMVIIVVVIMIMIVIMVVIIHNDHRPTPPPPRTPAPAPTRTPAPAGTPS
jgi:hypothetical protein